MRQQPHLDPLSPANYNHWTVFGFASLARLLSSVESSEIVRDCLQPTLYGVETNPGPLPETTLLHYLHIHTLAPAPRLALFKQLAAGLRYAALVGLDLDFDDVYVDERADASNLANTSRLCLHIVSRGLSVLRVLRDPEQHQCPDGGIFIQAGHPLAWFEVGPAPAVSEFAMSAISRRFSRKARRRPAACVFLHGTRRDSQPIWAWAPSLASAVADFDVLAAGVSQINLSH